MKKIVLAALCLAACASDPYKACYEMSDPTDKQNCFENVRQDQANRAAIYGAYLQQQRQQQQAPQPQPYQMKTPTQTNCTQWGNQINCQTQ